MNRANKKGIAWLMALAGLLLLAHSLSAQPSPTLLVSMTGEGAQHRLGHSVASAGKVDGDGYDYVIVGAIWAGVDGEGRAYIYHGGPGMDATADLILAGQTSDDTFGEAVASAGDMNGDSYDDVIVDASGSDVGVSDGGAAFIYYGGPGMDATADVILTGRLWTTPSGGLWPAPDTSTAMAMPMSSWAPSRPGVMERGEHTSSSAARLWTPSRI